MIDLKVFTADSVPYYMRLRARIDPSGVTEYGERAGSAPGFKSKPPFPLSALECADLEVVALWRILAHYGEHDAYVPYMLARDRKVVGVRSGNDEVVHMMAGDAQECLEWDDGGRVTLHTIGFCDWVRGKTTAVVGVLASGGDWITQEEACDLYGLNPKSLWWRRENSGIKFEKRNGVFLYDRDSLAAVAWGTR